MTFYTDSLYSGMDRVHLGSSHSPGGNSKDASKNDFPTCGKSEIRTWVSRFLKISTGIDSAFRSIQSAQSNEMKHSLPSILWSSFDMNYENC